MTRINQSSEVKTDKVENRGEARRRGGGGEGEIKK